MIKITKKSTLFILDWDDTLFPTNWVIKNGINMTQASSRDQYTMYFQELDRVLSHFLKKLTCLGKVIIVTNAMPDWIKISSIVLPNTYGLLRNIVVVSAREKYRNKSQKMMDWKTMAFHDIIDKEFSNLSFMNIISIGDAEYEYQALITLQYKKKGSRKYLKSIRFLKDPSHDVLIDQIKVSSDAVQDVWNKQQQLDLRFDHLDTVVKHKKRKTETNAVLPNDADQNQFARI